MLEFIEKMSELETAKNLVGERVYNFAIRLKFKAHLKKNEKPSFTKGKKHIWYSCSSGPPCYGPHWVCADLIDDYYRNHRQYKDLAIALQKEG